TWLEHWQGEPIADGCVADVEIAAPGPLPVQAGRDFPFRGDAEGPYEWRDRPSEAIVEVQGAIASCAARPGRMVEDSRGVFAGQFRPAGGFAERPAPGTDGNPGVIVNQNLLENDNKRVAPFGTVHRDR